MAEVTMPRLSGSMEQGTIIRWLRSDGEFVNTGDELLEIETDKATISVESEHSGVLAIVAADGETLAVGALIGHVGSDRAPRTRNGVGPAAAQAPMPATAVAAAQAPTPATAVASASGRVHASPVARRLAARLAVRIEDLRGTGPGGRVVKADVERAASNGDSAHAGEADSPNLAEGQEDVTVEPLTSVQATIARRMTEAKATMPDFTLTTEVAMDAALELRARLAELKLDPAPSVNDLVLRACALALRAHPRVNASYSDGEICLHRRVNIGVAVATPDALLVPVVSDADTRSLAEIAAASRSLAQRARAGALTPAQVSGATFTISNLGMFGITQFNAILNPPQAAILAVGAIREAPAARDGQVVVARRMSLTLTCDHRVLYGADAAVFMQSIATTLEQPLRLLV